MNIKNVSKKIKDDILLNRCFLKHKHILIIGENNSGKSKLLKNVLKKLLTANIYFIDSSNRKITSKIEEMKKGFSDFNTKDIIEARLKEDNFNREDIFSDNDGSEIVLSELFKNFEDYKVLFKEVLNLNMEKHIEVNGLSTFGEVYYITLEGDRLEIVSDGIRAMIRILMEVEFARKNDCLTIFIDELNMNLDHKNSWGLIEKLKNKYLDVRFIITCHSVHTVLGVSCFDVIKIIKQYDCSDDNTCVVFDSNDLDNVEIIERKLFGTNINNSNTDVLLSNSLKFVLSGHILDGETITKLDVASSSLTLRQQVIYNFIKERSGQV